MKTAFILLIGLVIGCSCIKGASVPVDREGVQDKVGLDEDLKELATEFKHLREVATNGKN